MKPARVLVLLVQLAVVLPGARAQWYNPDKVNRKAQMVYSSAVDELRAGAWSNGKQLLRAAIKLDSRFVDAWLSLGGACGQMKQYDSAVYFYEYSRSLDSLYFRDFLLPYSINLAGLGRFADANTAITQFLAIPNLDNRSKKAAEYRRDCYAFALDFEKKHPYVAGSFNPVNLGDSINSPRSEYYPSFTIDDSLLVFTRRVDGGREDFYRSALTEKGYSRATPVEGRLNTKPFKGAINLSQDGEWMFFAGDFGAQGFGNFDIYLTYATPQGWSEPYNMGENLNTEFWESGPSLSPDKRTLYFSSDRPGGFGGKDLYTSTLLPNGQWTPAENMGPTINTAADDLAPFIHADNQTLYFTSGGHPGYGGSDIYLVRRGPGGQWSLPENLGFPINTIEDDGSLAVASDAQTAFFASARADSRGGLDLYRFLLPKYASPAKTLWVKGTVSDAKTGKGLPSAVELKDLATGEVLQKITTDEKGFYLVTLPVGKDYSFTVNRSGYLYYSDQFLLASQPPDSTYRKDIALQPIAVNTTVELKNILFETNSFKLKNASFTELDKLVQLLKDNPTLKVQIAGHTDNTGKPADNLLLSTNRAKSVADYVVSKGIAKERITYKGFGSTKPVAENSTEAGRARNRRTEMVVVGL